MKPSPSVWVRLFLQTWGDRASLCLPLPAPRPALQQGPSPTWDPEAAWGKASEPALAQTSERMTSVLIHSALPRVVLFPLMLLFTAQLPGEQAGSSQIN